MDINLADFAPEIYDDFLYSLFEDKYNYYVVKGGRGGIKSSIISMCIVLFTASGRGDSICFRRHKIVQRDSCYADCEVAIERLGLEDSFKCTHSPMKITHKASGCTIYFGGLDDAKKYKSKKAKKGFRICWFEECAEMKNEKELRDIVQSVARGKDNHCNVIYSFNPPSNPEHFVNKGLVEESTDKLILHVNYLDVPPEFLGEQFFNIANALKKSNELAYRNEYLGEIVGSEGMVFSNVRLMPPDLEYSKEYLNRGIDFGFSKLKSGDPCVYVVNSYDEATKTLYIFHEWYKKDSSYSELADAIKAENIYDFRVYADCEDPGAIKALNEMGCRGVESCKKPKDSIKLGIKFLQDCSTIYISEDCPETYREFSSYCYVPARIGERPSLLSPENNHTIDAVRYSLQEYLY